MYRIRTLLTENGIQFANQARNRYAILLLFDRMCQTHEIERRLTKLKPLDQRAG
jgi:hypothetical protein